MKSIISFAVTDEDTDAIYNKIMSANCKPEDKLQYIVFALDGEKWKRVKSGPMSDSFFSEIVAVCPENEARQIIFRSKDGQSDVWIVYLPETANVKERMHFATAGKSLFARPNVPRHRFEIRSKADLTPENPELAPFLK